MPLLLNKCIIKPKHIKDLASCIVMMPVTFLLAKAEPGHRCKLKEPESYCMLALQLQYRKLVVTCP